MTFEQREHSGHDSRWGSALSWWAVCLGLVGASVFVIGSRIEGSPVRKWLTEIKAGEQLANLETALADLAALKGTVDTYILRSRAQELPTWDSLITPDERGTVWLEGYSEPPKDPWGNEYQLLPWDRGFPDYQIQSWGPDGLQDTEDDLSSKR